MERPDVCIVHVARVEDRDAFDALRHSTHVIATQRLEQVVMLLDECQGFLTTWSAALAAQIQPILCCGLSLFGKVRALRSEFAKLCAERTIYAVHLHGLEVCLLAARALRGLALQARVLYSPHRSHVGEAWSAALVTRLLQSELSRLDCAPVAGSLMEAEVLSKLLKRSAEVMPQPVGEVFFSAIRQEERPPRVLVEGSAADAADVAARLCVLLNGREPRIRFGWLGAADAHGRAKLLAADVAIVDAPDDAERAQALSRASAFIHLSPANALPLAAARAMAAGVPCLVSDTRPHRTLIRHGDTGFICTSERDFVEKLIVLLRDASERKRIGEAARDEAERLFSRRHFENAILRAYGLARRVPPRPVLTIAATGTGTHAL